MANDEVPDPWNQKHTVNPVTPPDARARHDADRLSDYLASMPGAGHGTLTRAALRYLLLSTNGQMFACGALYNITSTHLGAGVYDVRLTPVR